MSNYDDDIDYELENFEDEEDTQKEKYITFYLSDEEYAIEIQYVIEIIGMQKFTHIPETASYVKGVIKLRDSVYPVIDMRKRFKLPEIEYTDRTCIIIVKIGERSIGLIADSVSEVLSIPDENISESGANSLASRSHFINGIGKLGERVVIILNINKVISEEEIEAISI